MNITEKLREQISQTNDVYKLEMTITMLLFGWVMDSEEKKVEYEELIELSVNRLNIIMLIKGEEHPLQQIDVKRDRKKIETYVMMSIMNGIVMDSEENKMSILGELNMN
jgi:hypothetical protein